MKSACMTYTSMVREEMMLRKRTGVCVLAIDETEHILLLSKLDPISGEWSLSFPYDHLDLGETPLEGAHRVLISQMGLYTDDLEEVGHFYPMDPITDAIHLYVARKPININNKIARESTHELIRLAPGKLAEYIERGIFLQGAGIILFSKVYLLKR